MKLEYTGHINDSGEVVFRNKKQLLRDILETGWKEFSITIAKKKKNRSYEQNRYYWGVVVALIRDRFIDLGNDVSSEETHDYLKHEFNYREIMDEKTGLVMRIPSSTTDMTTTEFCTYIEKIQIFASTILDINIPSPNQQVEIFK